MTMGEWRDQARGTAAPTLRSLIDNAPLAELLVTLGRLRDLPEFGMARQLNLLGMLYDDALLAEENARRRREAVRSEARDLLEAVREHWAEEAILEATGFRP